VLAVSEVLFEAHDGVAVITLNAPARRNALTPDMGQRLSEICDEIEANRSIGAAVIRGAGGHFCSGAHRRVLSEAEVNPADPQSYSDNTLVYGSFYRFGQLGVPTVAAVCGAAVGAGMNLLLAADLRVVADNCRLQAGFLRLGIHPGGGHFVLMNRLAGREATAAMVLFSEEISGAEAHRVGLAWEVLPQDRVDTRAMELAARAARDPELSRAAVRSFRRETDTPGVSWDVALHAERPTQMWSLRRRGLIQLGSSLADVPLT
jgi:enoyl-CoA hydratase